ncbi:MAG: hypothetical protein HC886_17705 [Leptolyngbyaceae cyanobacterium SM1_1_3]|nr:hypothetical protein [Leptolyngbyaceae cyanobacterium SM1_1_3]NJN01595.1 hypothetical protein [Leptolyngbyaceae cyanobacterium RM1_1_2]
MLLPRHSPTQALANLVQLQLIATQCGPLRQYLNLVPLHPTGTLVVLWREAP